MPASATRAATDVPAFLTGEREFYPLRAVDVIAAAIFWAFVAIVSAASRELDPRVPGISDRITSAVILGGYVEYTLWALITLPMLFLTSRYTIEGGRRVGRLAFFLVLGIAIAIVMDSLLLRVRESLLADLATIRRRVPVAVIGLGFLDDLMVYFAVLGAGVARDFFLRYRTRLQETVRLQAQLVEARLDALRAQLDPHFLFNTLNSVSALVERDPRGARRMIARLSDLLRYTLEESSESEVPLKRELDLVAEYVELMQIRFQDRLAVEISVDGEFRRALVPNLILQPVVENAIKHGVSRISGPGRIEISARRRDGDLVLTVADNGPGPNGGAEGVGLRITNARLREHYGPGYRVTLKKRVQGGTEAELALPLREQPLAATPR